MDSGRPGPGPAIGAAHAVRKSAVSCVAQRHPAAAAAARLLRGRTAVWLPAAVSAPLPGVAGAQCCWWPCPPSRLWCGSWWETGRARAPGGGTASGTPPAGGRSVGCGQVQLAKSAVTLHSRPLHGRRCCPKSRPHLLLAPDRLPAWPGRGVSQPCIALLAPPTQKRPQLSAKASSVFSRLRWV